MMEDEMLTYWQIRRIDYKFLHICVKCGQRRAVEGQLYCEECRKKHRDRQRARYYSLKEQGLCVSCGHGEATHGVYCEECRQRNKQRRIERLAAAK